MLQRGNRLERESNYVQPSYEHETNPSDEYQMDLLGLLSNVRRNLRLIFALTMIGTVLAYIVVTFAIAPQYRAVASILLETRKTQLLKDQEVLSSPGTDKTAIESEAELMKSPPILYRVAKELALSQYSEFQSGRPLPSRPKATIGGSDGAQPDPSSDKNEAEIRAAAAILGTKINAQRRKQTYVLELEVWSRAPERAAAIANKTAEAYLDFQIDMKNGATIQATHWLKDESERLRKRLIESEKAYEAYKAEAGLFSAGGENLTDQQIAQLNEQLVKARTEAGEAAAKYRQLQQIDGKNLKTAAASSDFLESPVLTGLRNRSAEAAGKRAQLLTRYGKRHPQVVTVEAELSTISQQIRKEVERMVSSAKTEYEMAQSREASLLANMETLKKTATQSNQKTVRLRELEREVQANRTLFDAFLTRAKETTAQLSIQMPDARIIALADPPTGAAYPKKAMIVGLGTFGGLTLGIALALIPALLSAGFKHIGELQSAIGLPALASIPLAQAKAQGPIAQAQSMIANSSPKLSWLMSNSNMSEQRRIANLVVNQPHSPISESIHALRFALRQEAAERGSISIVITSALPGEGKSTITANLARACALSGDRVLLIDADLRKPTIAAKLGIKPTPGLKGVLMGECDLNEAIKRDRQTNLHVMAGGDHLNGAEALGLLASDNLRQLLNYLGRAYELILIDSSPLLAVTDPRCLINHADGVALVVASEMTSRTAIKTALMESALPRHKLLGVVMNRVVDDFLRNYSQYSSAYDKVA